MNEYFLYKKVIICKDTEEKCIGYNNYLQSKHWINLRKRKLIEQDYKCQKCKKRQQQYKLQIHHKTYKHIGHEYKVDLILLCEDCHKKAHIKKEKVKKQNARKEKIIQNNKYQCKYFELCKCLKYNCRCFDCKEYKHNKSYIDKTRGYI